MYICVYGWIDRLISNWHPCLNAGLFVQSWGSSRHFMSVPCDLGEFHTLSCASVWALLLHHEAAIKRNSSVDTFLFMFSSMSRCWYKLPPRVTLQILNTCLALINSSQVFQAPWKCWLSSPPPTPGPAASNNTWTDLWLSLRCLSLCLQREKWPEESFWTS